MLDVGRHRSWWPPPAGFPRLPASLLSASERNPKEVGFASLPRRSSCSRLLHSSRLSRIARLSPQLGSVHPRPGSCLRPVTSLGRLSAQIGSVSPELRPWLWGLSARPSASLGRPVSAFPCLPLPPNRSHLLINHCTWPPVGVNRFRLSSSPSLPLMPLRSLPSIRSFALCLPHLTGRFPHAMASN